MELKWLLWGRGEDEQGVISWQVRWRSCTWWTLLWSCTVIPSRQGKHKSVCMIHAIWSVTSEHMSPHFTEEQRGNQRGRGQRSTRTKYQLKHTKHTRTVTRSSPWTCATRGNVAAVQRVQRKSTLYFVSVWLCVLRWDAACFFKSLSWNSISLRALFSLILTVVLTQQVGGQTKEQTFTRLLPTERFQSEYMCVCVCALLSSVYVSICVSSSFWGFPPTVSGDLQSVTRFCVERSPTFFILFEPRQDQQQASDCRNCKYHSGFLCERIEEN